MLKGAIPTSKLTRGGFFSVEKEILKIQKRAASPENDYFIIEEGVIKADTAIMKDPYNTYGSKK